MNLKHVTACRSLVLYLFIFGVVITGCADKPARDADRQKFAEELEQSLKQDLLDKWYPLVVDTVHGGYLSGLSRDWQPVGEQNKMVVTQARHIWSLAEASRIFPERREQYHKMAAQGVEFMKDYMWDEEHGGFYSLVNREGQPIEGDNSFTATKHTYGNAFAVYGLAKYAEVFGKDDHNALQWAKKTFRWMEDHSHDPEYGGYYTYLKEDGSPYRQGFMGQTAKDQNCMIHVMEAFTELYPVWKNDTLKSRLEESLTLVRDTIRTEKNYLNLFFKKDWTPITYQDSTDEPQFYPTDHVSFGHDVETAYLMLDAAKELGQDLEPTWTPAKKMVDHSLENGWDEEEGGLYYAGFYASFDEPLEVVQKRKTWWAQAEALNMFLMMDQRFPDSQHNYYGKARKTWAYIQNYLIDKKHGGWYRDGIDETPKGKDRPKSDIWKATYHTVRTYVNALEMLETRN